MEEQNVQMPEENPTNPKITRRQFLKTAAAALVAAATAPTLKKFDGLFSENTASVVPALESSVGEDNPPTEKLRPIPDRLERLSRERDPVTRRLCGTLFPLFDLPRYPSASTFVSTAEKGGGMTYNDFIHENLDITTNQHTLFNKGYYDLSGQWHEFTMEEVIVGNEKLKALKIAESDGPTELAFFQVAQGHPHLFLEGPKELDIIFEIDGKTYRFRGEDFFNRFSPLTVPTSVAGSNVSSLPLYAEKSFKAYLHPRSPSIKLGDKDISPLLGWFNLQLNHYHPDSGLPVLNPDFLAKSLAVTQQLAEAIMSIQLSRSFRLPEQLYGEQLNTEERGITLGKQVPEEVLIISNQEACVGLRVSIQSDEYLQRLRDVEVELVYTDNQSLRLPFQYLFGALNENNADLTTVVPYQNLYTGHLPGPQVGHHDLYTNYPLAGIQELRLRTTGGDVNFQLTQLKISKDRLPESLKAKKFVPVLAENYLEAGDILLMPPTQKEGIVAGLFFHIPEWQRKKGEGEGFPFGPNPNWRQFYLEYNPSIYRFNPDSEKKFYHLQNAGSFTGWEDLFSSFYSPDIKNQGRTNMQKGDLLHGGFTFHKYQEWMDEIESGIWSHLLLPTQGQTLVLPAFGYDKRYGNVIINRTKVRSLAFAYLSSDELLPNASFLKLCKELEIPLTHADLIPEGSDLPCSNIYDYEVRYNLKQVRDSVLSGKTLSPEQKQYLERAGAYYDLLIHHLKEKQYWQSQTKILPASYSTKSESAYNALF